MERPADVRRNATVAAGWAAVGLVVAFTLWVAATTISAAVDLYTALPFSDQWVTVAELKAIDDGSSTLANQLWRQHNEHRLVIPRIVFYADFRLFDGRNHLSLAMIWVMQAALLAIIAAAAWALVRDGRRWPLWPAGIVVAQAALLLSACQLENFTWGFQVQFVGVYLAATVAFFALAFACAWRQKDARLGWSLFAASVLAATAGQLMLASGNFIWPVLAVIVAWYAASRTWFLLIVFVGGVQILLYFIGYDQPPDQTSPLEGMAHPLEVGRYFLALLGNPAGTLGMRSARLLGVACLAVYAVVLLVIVHRRERSPQVAGLFAVMTFAVGSALSTSLGRFEFGPEQAFSSRYTAGPLLFWACALPLFRWMWLVYSPAGLLRWSPLVLAPVAILGAAGLVDAQRQVPDAFRERQSGWFRAETAMLSSVFDPEAFDPIFVPLAITPEFQESMIGWLRAEGYSVFASEEAGLPGTELAAAFEIASQGECTGFLDTIRPVPDSNGLRVYGWAWDTGAAAAARTIVLADERGIIVGIGQGGVLDRPDVHANVIEVTDVRTGWEGHAGAPPGEVQAFAVLGDRACPLSR